jgi:hypothetical protein
VIWNFLPDIAGKRQRPGCELTGLKRGGEAAGAARKASTLFASPRGASMKLHLKIGVLLAYVALCTHMVLTALEAEPLVPSVPLPHAISD